MKIQNVLKAAVLGTVWVSGAVFAADAKVIAQGKKAYTTNCEMCHGAKLDGMGVAGAALNPKPRNFLVDKLESGETVAAIAEVAANGFKRDGKPTLMPGFAYIPEADRKAIAEYILSVRSKAKPKK